MAKKTIRTVLIDGITYQHGDYVRFKPTTADGADGYEDDEVIGRISISESYDGNPHERRFHVCQNEYDGCSSVDDVLGYEYSWSVTVDLAGRIKSSDTEYIKPHFKEKVETNKPCEPCDVSNFFCVNVENVIIFDDDKMPDDWECDVDLKQLKKELNEIS